jgi:TolA-binding protein
VGVRADDSSASAPLDPAAKEELAYVRALVEANLPDFAAPVIAAAKVKWPVLAPKLKVYEIDGDLRMGRFEKVQKVLDACKKGSGEYWSIRLAMGDAYYARSQNAECAKIYKEFFAAVPKPGVDIMDFYVSSGFKWAQMCSIDKRYDEAIKMYESLLAKMPKKGENVGEGEEDPDETRWCMVAQQYVELLLRLAGELDSKNPKRAEYLKKADGVVKVLLWKQDLIIVFGKAISMRAHIEMLRGRLGKAQQIVNEFLPTLREIHKSLVEQDPTGSQGALRLSPMPECRYLLSRILWQEVKREAAKAKVDEDVIKNALFGDKDKSGRRNGLGAYNHAINVYVNYPESAWAASAGNLTEEIEGFVKSRYKKDIRTNVTAGQMKKVRDMQFKNAFDVYSSHDLKKTVDVYLDLLSQFPEYPESVGALDILAESYIGLWQDEKDVAAKQMYRINAETVEGYIAERFAEKGALARSAGDMTLRLAAVEHDAGALGRSAQLYDLYFKNYKDHYKAPATALSLAGAAYGKQDWAAAVRYYEMVATVYTNSAYYTSALQLLSTCHGKLGHAEEQEMWLRRFASAAVKPVERATARLSLAQMQQKRGFAAFSALDAESAAGGTNDVDEARLAAYRAVAGAIRDFRTTANEITEALDNDKTLGEEARKKLAICRGQAQFLEGTSWQRLSWPVDKVAVFRKQAVKALESYLEFNPKGEFASRVLVRIATICTADKDVEGSQKALARLQRDFPESDEAKNSVPRLAKTLIEMGLRQEGVEQYRQMLATQGGKYSALQFLQAGDALLEARSWDVAAEAYGKALVLVKSEKNEKLRGYIEVKAMLGQAKVGYGQKAWAEAHSLLADFIAKYSKSSDVVEAYEMLSEVAAEEGRREQDAARRQRLFNEAVGAVKKLRGFKKTWAEKDLITLRSAGVTVRQMEAEEQMGLSAEAKETCRRAVVTLIAFVQSHAPSAAHPAKDMTPAQLENLERCYGMLLPLMVKLGSEYSGTVLEYGAVYNELFPEGKHKTAVQNAMAAAAADKK